MAEACCSGLMCQAQHLWGQWRTVMDPVLNKRHRDKQCGEKVSIIMGVQRWICTNATGRLARRTDILHPSITLHGWLRSMTMTGTRVITMDLIKLDSMYVHFCSLFIFTHRFSSSQPAAFRTLIHASSNSIVAQIRLAASDLDQLSGINFKTISFAPDTPVPPTNGVTIKAQIVRGKPSHHVSIHVQPSLPSMDNG
jgi:hypothetical protein